MACIARLPDAVSSALRSSSVLSDYARIVEELVANSVDAGSSKIFIYVNLKLSYIKVEDDGCGIKREDLSLVGLKHATSKLHTLEELNVGIKTLGFRGEALSSLSDIAVLEVRTRARSSANSYKKIIKNCKCISLGLCKDMKESGTIVVAQDMFYNQPVRRRQIQASSKKVLPSIKERVLQIALICPHIAFKVTDLERENNLIETTPSSSPLYLLRSIFGDELTCNLHPIHFSKGKMELSGFLSKSITAPSKVVQFLYINSRYVHKTPIHKLLNSVNNMQKSGDANLCEITGALGKRGKDPVKKSYPAFVLNLSCPHSTYDVTFEFSKTLVEFKDWQPVISFVNEVLQNIWGDDVADIIQGPGQHHACHPSYLINCLDKMESSVSPLNNSLLDSYHQKSNKKERSTKDPSVLLEKTAAISPGRKKRKLGHCTHSPNNSNYMLENLFSMSSDETPTVLEYNTKSKQRLISKKESTGFLTKRNKNSEYDYAQYHLNEAQLCRETSKGVYQQGCAAEEIFDIEERYEHPELHQEATTNSCRQMLERTNLENEKVLSSPLNIHQGHITSYSGHATVDFFVKLPFIEEMSNLATSPNSGSEQLFRGEFSHRKDFQELSTISDWSENESIMVEESPVPLPLIAWDSPCISTKRQNRYPAEYSPEGSHHLTSNNICQSIDGFSSGLSNSVYMEKLNSCCKSIKFDDHLCSSQYTDESLTFSMSTVETQSFHNLDDIRHKCYAEHDELLRMPRDYNIFSNNIESRTQKNLLSTNSRESISGTNHLSPSKADIWNMPTLRHSTEARGRDHLHNYTKAKKRRSLSAPPFYRPRRKYGFHKNPFSSLSTIENANKEAIHAFTCSGPSPQPRNFARQQQYFQMKDLPEELYPEQCLGLALSNIDESSYLETSNNNERKIVSNVNQHEQSVISVLSSSTPVSILQFEDHLHPSYDMNVSEQLCITGGEEDNILDVSTGSLYLHNSNLVPESLNRDCFMQAKVLQQVDKKYIAIVAQGILALVDQHAADERIRLEELRKMVLDCPGKQKVTVLEVEEELVLPDGGLQLLQNYSEQIMNWGWRYRILGSSSHRNVRHLYRSCSRAILTAVPSILCVDLTAEDLYEYIRQLAQTDGSSAAPPAVLRILNSKSCRGAIMFGDLLFPSECTLLIEELKKTSLCFQCAHGRPTTVPLVNLNALHNVLAKFNGGMKTSELLADIGIPRHSCHVNTFEGWHGLRKHRASIERSRRRLAQKSR